MAKDAKGHGSNARGSMGKLDTGMMTPAMQRMIGQPAHQAGVNMVGGKKQITIFHQDGEYAVPIPGNRGHSFTNDKADAEGTARQMHGQDITIKHRAKSWGPEMD